MISLCYSNTLYNKIKMGSGYMGSRGGAKGVKVSELDKFADFGPL